MRSASRRVFSRFLVIVIASLACARQVAGKLEMLGAAVIPDLESHIACSVCNDVVQAAYVQTADAKKNVTQSGKRWMEEAVLEVLDTVCNPRTPGGSWIRRYDIVAIDADPAGSTAAAAAPRSIMMDRQPHYGKCKRKCWTIADICSRIVDDPEQDELSATLYLSRKSYKDIAAQVCKSSCAKLKRAALLPVDAKLKQTLLQDTFDPIDDGEVEVEEMMERMRLSGQGGPGVEVYGRDEMMEMQDAIRRGDRKAVERIDASIAQLSDDEFMQLRQIQANEDIQRQEDENFGSVLDDFTVDQEPKARKRQRTVGAENEPEEVEEEEEGLWSAFKGLFGF